MRVVAVVAIAAISTVVHGQTFTARGPGDDPGETLAASATFSVSNLDLIVTLSNTSTYDPMVANDILTGIFFTIDGDPKLTPESAEVAPASSVVGRTMPPGFTGDVGSQWAYRNDLVGAPNGTDEGISTASLRWFGPRDLFPYEKIRGIGSFGGVSFGLTTLNDLPGNDRAGLRNQPVIQNSVVFTFAGLPEDFSVSDISHVTFQYGTDLRAPELDAMANGVPEPPTMALVVAGILGALVARKLAAETKKEGCGHYLQLRNVWPATRN
jgi:hypothetical protein